MISQFREAFTTKKVAVTEILIYLWTLLFPVILTHQNKTKKIYNLLKNNLKK